MRTPPRQRLPVAGELVPSSSSIDDPAERAFFVRQYQLACGLPSTVTHFAAAAPRSLERRDLTALGDDTIVSLKTDGCRFLLLLTHAPDGACAALMINRAMAMWEVDVKAHAKFFAPPGSLFDGELVWEWVNWRPTLRYVVFDVARCAGALHTQAPFATRLQVIFRHVLTEHALSDEAVLERDGVATGEQNAHELAFATKRFVPARQLAQLWAQRVHSHHKNDGLILADTRCKMDFHTSTSFYKWKSSHTVDVLARRAGAESAGRAEGEATAADEAAWVAYAQSAGVAVPLEVVRAPAHGGALRVELRDNEVLADGAIVECECRLADGALVLFALKRRGDKASANAVHTIERTLVNVAEGVGVDELVAHFSGPPDPRRA